VDFIANLYCFGGFMQHKTARKNKETHTINSAFITFLALSDHFCAARNLASQISMFENIFQVVSEFYFLSFERFEYKFGCKQVLKFNVLIFP
jgi:hypothetical protein